MDYDILTKLSTLFVIFSSVARLNTKVQINNFRRIRMKTFFITLVFSVASLLLLAQTEFTAEVKYISKNDTADIGQVSESEFEYKNSTSGEVHEKRDFISITSVYPNPANKEANFDLEWHQQTTEAKIVISNLLGTTVREVELRDYVATVKIDTESLDEGMYFYSLIIKNRPTITQKLIIRH
jgi:hypothetical protein